MVKLIIYSIFLIASAFFTFLLFPSLIHSKIWMIFIFLISLTILSQLGIKFFIPKQNEILIFLGTMALRLLTSFIFIAYFAFGHLPNLLTFVCDFLVLYLFYMGFDIYILLITLRPNLKSRDKQ